MSIPAFFAHRGTILAAAGMFLTLSVSAKPFTCAELTAFVESIARYRDQGIPLSTAKAAVSDGKMSREDKKRFAQLIEEIYAKSSIAPLAWGAIAAETCRTTKRGR